MKIIEKIRNMSEETRIILFLLFIILLIMFFYSTYQYNQEKTKIVETKLIASGNWTCDSIELPFFGKVYKSCERINTQLKWQNILNLTISPQ